MKRSIRNASIAGGSAVVLGAAAVAAVALAHPGAHPATASPASSAISKGTRAKLLDAACTGPAGAAYVADAGWDGFSIINTSNCSVDYYTYNVGTQARRATRTTRATPPPTRPSPFMATRSTSPTPATRRSV